MTVTNMRATEGSAEANASDALRLSKEYIHHLWSCDYEWCVNRVVEDFVWIGSRKDYYTTTRDGFAELLAAGGIVSQKSTVTDEEYSVVGASERMCSVAGRFLVLTPPATDTIYAHWHRCTLVWRRSGKRMVLAHLHLSAPVDFVEEGDSYPIAAGTDTYRYMRSLMRLGSSRKSVSLYDVEGTMHWVHPSQIIYLEASRKRTIVHCVTKDIVVPAVIRDAVEMVDNKIMRVHRSYAVNRDHVVELKAGILLLDDGTSIAIPAKRIADVRAELTGR